MTLSCFATNALFTSLIEPVVLKRKVRPKEIFFGMLVIPGIVLIMQFTGGKYLTGIILGLIAAFGSALFSTLNKIVVDQVKPLQLTFVELTSGFIFLSILMPAYFQWENVQKFAPTWVDIQYLIVFSVVCTVIAFFLSVNALKHISAFSSNLAFNLEPVYGVLLAIPILHEDRELGLGFYAGMAIILFAVFSFPFLNKSKGLDQ